MSICKIAQGMLRTCSDLAARAVKLKPDQMLAKAREEFVQQNPSQVTR
jgi:hypothetical protein